MGDGENRGPWTVANSASLVAVLADHCELAANPSGVALDEWPEGEDMKRETYHLNAAPGAVDAEAGVMRDITIIAFGEAKGHDAFVDDATLAEAISLLIGKSLKAYVTHDGAYGDRTLGAVGLFGGFYLQDGKIKAATFTAFDRYKRDEADRYNRLFELAQMAPDEFGISIVFNGSLAWPLRSGEDLPFEDSQPPDGAVREVPSIRIESIESADFVAQPAATPSLFNEDGGNQLDEPAIDNMSDTETTLDTEEITEDVEAEEVTTEEVLEAIEETEEPEAEEPTEEPEVEGTSLNECIERIEVLEALLTDAEERVAKLDQLIEGQPALDAQPDEIQTKTVREQYLSLTGAEKSNFWKAHKQQILLGK